MDDMMLMDDAALEELDLIEVGVSSAVGPSGHSTSTGPASSSLLGSVVVPARREEQIQETHVESDIIVIDSEDDEGDKENMPIPTRHVRRRTQQRVEVQLNDDVIDISSSE
jgi:RecQ-mediated genome instability protein 1